MGNGSRLYTISLRRGTDIFDENRRINQEIQEIPTNNLMTIPCRWLNSKLPKIRKLLKKTLLNNEDRSRVIIRPRQRIITAVTAGYPTKKHVLQLLTLNFNKLKIRFGHYNSL